MRDAWYWFMFGIMLTSAAANLYACVRSALTWRRARKSWETAQEVLTEARDLRDATRVAVAEEIFEDIWDILAVHAYRPKSEDYAAGACDTLEWVDEKIAELEKKYIPTEITNKGEEQ